MMDDMLKWVKSILRKWSKYETKEEVLSLSWDCFLYCLNEYKPAKKTPIPYFFFDYSRYFLLNNYAKKDRVFLPIEELKEILSVSDNNNDMAFEKLLTLAQFSSIVPEKYQIVWSDAMHSTELEKRGNAVVTVPHGMDRNIYVALKKVFVEQIKFLMR